MIDLKGRLTDIFDDITFGMYINNPDGSLSPIKYEDSSLKKRYIQELLDLIADYIESIELPKHREMTEEMTPPSELTNAYLLNQWAILEDLNGVTEAYNNATKDCQAKLDEAVKALKENK